MLEAAAEIAQQAHLDSQDILGKKILAMEAIVLQIVEDVDTIALNVQLRELVHVVRAHGTEIVNSE